MKCSEPIRASSYTIALRSQKGPGGQVHLKAELRRIPLPRTRMNKGKKRKGRNPLGPRPRFRGLAIPRIGYFRLATLLRLGQLVLDSVFDPPGASLLLFLGGGLLAVVSLAPASPGGFVQLVPDVVLAPPEPVRWSSRSVILYAPLDSSLVRAPCALRYV
jgi:hypothetical protein